MLLLPSRDQFFPGSKDSVLTKRKRSLPASIKAGVLICFSLIVLGSAQSADSSVPSDEQSGRKFLVAYMGSARQFDFWEKLRDGVVTSGKRLGLTIVDYSTREFSVELQKAGIKRLIRDGADGLILGAAGDDLGSAIDWLEDARIPVVTVDVAIRHPWIGSHIATGNAEAALLASEYLLSVVRKRGVLRRRILVLTGDRNHDNARIRGLASASFFERNGFSVSVHFSPAWSGSKSLLAALNEFSSNGDDIAGVFAAFAPASMAMVEAAERHKLDAVLVGFDLNDRMRQMLVSKKMDATIIQDPRRMGNLGVEVIAAILNGEKVAPRIDVPAVLVTPETVGRH